MQRILAFFNKNNSVFVILPFEILMTCKQTALLILKNWPLFNVNAYVTDIRTSIDNLSDDIDPMLNKIDDIQNMVSYSVYVFGLNVTQ